MVYEHISSAGFVLREAHAAIERQSAQRSSFFICLIFWAKVAKLLLACAFHPLLFRLFYALFSLHRIIHRSDWQKTVWCFSKTVWYFTQNTVLFFKNTVVFYSKQCAVFLNTKCCREGVLAGCQTGEDEMQFPISEKTGSESKLIYWL
jgi:hypothetical protein